MFSASLDESTYNNPFEQTFLEQDNLFQAWLKVFLTHNTLHFEDTFMGPTFTFIATFLSLVSLTVVT